MQRRVGSQTRTEIVRAAGELMLDHGYAALAYRSVASWAGVAAVVEPRTPPDIGSEQA
ncbi:hypothetical protein AB0E01_03480 [Nocardia vinacea]|uniref:hypothetical protein n=1 Tax=Nocardia vinacea TaxID=96468 RepID=UPI0033E49F3E